MRPQISDLVAQLLSNRRCHGNHCASFVGGREGRPHVSPRAWSWCNHP